MGHERIMKGSCGTQKEMRRRVQRRNEEKFGMWIVKFLYLLLMFIFAHQFPVYFSKTYPKIVAFFHDSFMNGNASSQFTILHDETSFCFVFFGWVWRMLVPRSMLHFLSCKHSFCVNFLSNRIDERSTSQRCFECKKNVFQSLMDGDRWREAPARMNERTKLFKFKHTYC